MAKWEEFTNEIGEDCWKKYEYNITLTIRREMGSRPEKHWLKAVVHRDGISDSDYTRRDDPFVAFEYFWENVTLAQMKKRGGIVQRAIINRVVREVKHEFKFGVYDL